MELSRAVFAEGIRPGHRLSPPVVHLAGERALAEVPTEISVIQSFGGVDTYVVSYTRLLYRLECLDSNWKISALDCIYERDTLVPVIYGTSPELDPDVLSRFRRPFMYLAYQLYKTAFFWLHRERG